jgi:hypothetical protein
MPQIETRIARRAPSCHQAARPIDLIILQLRAFESSREMPPDSV